MNLDRNLLQSSEYPLMGFGGRKVDALGKISLPYLYLAIFGRGTLNKFEAIIHQLYLIMKIPAPRGIITV